MGQLTVEELCNSESFAQFIAPESIEFVVSNFTKFVMGEEYEHHYSFYFIRTDGEMRLCEKYMTHYTDKNGSRFLVISMLDVTEQRKNEAEKYAQLEELQRWQKVTLGREDRNMELKKEVNELLKRLNEPIRYKSQNEN
ncbi:MAG: hypothetical protein A2265_06270 [Bacteroidetes bacterium RIFOXYA12_FULL_33_9]|nr:MAG: hypothetical protein A2265_06270 [Bacteroidetes bacterium RIFOXYA12_FULL_33_9]